MNNKQKQDDADTYTLSYAWWRSLTPSFRRHFIQVVYELQSYPPKGFPSASAAEAGHEDSERGKP